MKNLSCQLTKAQVRAGTKDVTRRNGWRNLKPGVLLQLVEKGMGLKKGESIVKLRVVRVKSVRLEPLRKMLDFPDYGRREVIREGFPEMSPLEFVLFFLKSHHGLTRNSLVTRIEWEYIAYPS